MAAKCPTWTRGRKYTLDGRRVSICEFLRSNAATFDRSDRSAIRQLKRGGVIFYGGGADAVFKLKRTR